jgi:hypothetical protein
MAAMVMHAVAACALWCVAALPVHALLFSVPPGSFPLLSLPSHPVPTVGTEERNHD